jgi:hypothetical protein
MQNFARPFYYAELAVLDVARRQINAFPVQLSTSDIPMNDTLILWKSGIAPIDIANAVYQGISSLNISEAGGVIYQQALNTLFTVAGVSNSSNHISRDNNCCFIPGIQYTT